MTEHEPVTVLFSRTAKAGKEHEYEAWNKELIRLSEKQPGHITTSVIEDGNRRYMTLQQFDSHPHLQAWLQSPERTERLEQLSELSEDSPEPTARTGMETWFRLPGHISTGHIPRWKMAVITYCIIYTFVLLFNIILAPHTAGLPVVVRSGLFPLVTVPLMTYLLLPWATKWLRRWLYR
jgi:antibiotic biosynthesis monooxygenase (ABM) superfamily enzyme